MKLDQNIKSESYLAKNMKKILNNIQKTRNPVVITQNGEASAVLQDVKSYETTKQALFMLKLMAQAENNIRKGDVSSHEAVMTRIENKLKNGNFDQ